MALSAGLILLSFGCAWAQQAAQKNAKIKDAPPVTAGRETFSTICASCHGLDGRGGERGPDIATRQEVARLSDQDLLKILQAGIPGKGMPAFAEFGPAKLASVVSYLRTLQGKGTEAQVSGDPQKGNEVFFGKGNCAACHMVDGKGGFLGPELSGYGGAHLPAEIRAEIVNPQARAKDRFRAADVIDRDGKTYSGLVRNEDNFSLQLQSTDGSFHFFSKSDLASVDYRKEPMMPTDYGSKLTAAELDGLTAYLVKVARESKVPRESIKRQEEF